MVCNVRSTVLVLAILTVGKVQFCQTCEEGKFRYEFSCYSCKEGCRTCTSGSHCNSCKEGYYLSNNDCIKCKRSCTSCSSAHTCDVCSDTYTLYNNACFYCPDANCDTCSSDYNCAACSDGYYLEQKTCHRCKSGCTTSCIQGYYLDGNNCESCRLPCATCNTSTLCLSCVSGYYLNVDGATCTACLEQCSTCASDKICKSCATGYYLQGNMCTQCPGLCTSCTSAAYCTACTTGYSLYNSLCCPHACSACRAHNYCTSCKAGYYMDRGQCKPCSNRCEHCGENNVCNDCKSEYRLMYGSCYTCPNDCGTCFGDDKCSSCRYSGYYVQNHACMKCPEKCVSCTSNTECTNCTNRFYGTNKCLQECSDKCEDSDCDISGRCKSCVDGMHGDNCNIECGQNCIRCDRNTGGCSSCETGTYLNNNQCERCSATCTQCTSSRCTECVVGQWGENCEKVCTTCKSGTPCRKNNGYCKQSCVDGMYGLGCTTRCSPKCVSCQRSSSSRCTVCVTNKYGYNSHYGYYSCHNDCPQNCFNSTCDDETGKCTFGCIDGMSGWWCTTRCSPKCVSCKRSYSSKCTACVTNKYGYNSRYGYYSCNNDCPQNCFNYTCDDETGECTFGCIDGYHGNKCMCPQNCNCDNRDKCSSCTEGFGNINQNCQCTNENCKDNDCSACTSLNYFVHDKTCCYCRVQDTNCEECTTHASGGFGRCTKCKTGFFPTSNKCLACSTHCNDTICDPVTGACTLGCNGHYWGSHCDKICWSCRQCDQQNGTCTVCQQGKYSPDCSKRCSQSCKTIDTNPTCAILDGACTGGCQSTMVHGSHCQQSCSINCTDEQCDWQTAHCLHGCTEHHYGNVCNNTCSQTCSTPKTGSRCYDSNGTCVNGCEVGYYGESCENQCSPNCVNTTCEQFTGSCLHGCSGRFEGDNCMMALSQAGGLTGTIAGGVGGLIVLCLIVLLIVALIRRRRSHKDEAGSPQKVVLYDVPQGVDADDVDDAGDNYNIEERNDDIEDVVYEQIDEGKDVQPDNTRTIVVDSVPQNEDNAKDKTEANEIVEYEQIDGERNLQEAFPDEDYLTMDGATGQGSQYEQLKPRNTHETNYSGLDVQDEDNITDTSYENMKIK